jgi:hypothetical protein
MTISAAPKSPAQSAGQFICNLGCSAGRVEGLPKAVALPGTPRAVHLGLLS